MDTRGRTRGHGRSVQSGLYEIGQFGRISGMAGFYR